MARRISDRQRLVLKRFEAVDMRIPAWADG